MRAHVCDMPGLVADTRGCEGVQKRVPLAPSAHVVHLDRKPAERRNNLSPVRTEILDQSTPGLRDYLPEPCQLDIPNVGLTGVRLEGRISLSKSPCVPHPGISESRFHVEHCPVHPTPPPVATLLNEAMNTGLYHLYRKGLR